MNSSPSEQAPSPVEQKHIAMTENSQSADERINQLTQFARRLIHGENGKMLIDEYQPWLETVNAMETMQTLDQLLEEGIPLATVKSQLGKILNVFYKSLQSQPIPEPTQGHFLHYLMLENRETEKRLAAIRPALKNFLQNNPAGEKTNLSQLRTFLQEIETYELHYLKKEYLLFPHLEEAFPQSRCLSIMWSFHDDFRKYRKQLSTLLASDKPDKAAINTLFGKLFFVIFPII